MHAIVLAAGVGSRLGELTEQEPKCLVKVAGKPILQHQLDAFDAAGISDVTIVTGYLSGEIDRWLARHHQYNVTVVRNDAYEFTNNMVSARMGIRDVVGEAFILCNGDVVFEPSIVTRLVNAPGDAIAVDLGTHDDEAMKVTVDASGAINAISKEITPPDSVGRSIDLYRFSAEGGTALLAMCNQIIDAESTTGAWTEVALQRCFDAGTIRAEVFDIRDARWVEIDDQHDLVLADSVFGSVELADFDHLFVDLDGTLTLDGAAIDGAADFIAASIKGGKTVQLVSNNSSRTAVQYREQLTDLGIDLEGADIVLSSEGLVRYLQDQKVTSVFCVGTEALVSDLEAAGIKNEETTAQYVVVGYDLELTYAKLATASQLVNAGIPYIATHCDIACPTSEGPVPDAGAIIEAIRITTGVEPLKVFGKPNREMLDHRITDPSRSLMIGDRLYTDKALADACGIAFACVLTGETQRSDLQSLDTNQWPAMVVRSVSDLA